MGRLPNVSLEDFNIHRERVEMTRELYLSGQIDLDELRRRLARIGYDGAVLDAEVAYIKELSHG